MEHQVFLYSLYAVIAALSIFSAVLFVASWRLSNELTRKNILLGKEEGKNSDLRKERDSANTSREKFKEQLQLIINHLGLDTTSSSLSEAAERVNGKYDRAIEIRDDKINSDLKTLRKLFGKILNKDLGKEFEFEYMIKNIGDYIDTKKGELLSEESQRKTLSRVLKESAKLYSVNPDLSPSEILNAFKKDHEAFSKTIQERNDFEKENKELKQSIDGLKTLKDSKTDIYYEKNILNPLKTRIVQLFKDSIKGEMEKYESKQTRTKLKSFVRKLSPAFNGKVESIKIKDFIPKK